MNMRGLHHRHPVTGVLTSSVQKEIPSHKDVIQFVFWGFTEFIRKIQNTAMSKVITIIIGWEHTLPAGTPRELQPDS